MNSVKEALGLSFAMGAVILFCRAFPFLFFGRGTADEKSAAGVPSLKEKFLAFVEKIVPPAAMTVLAVNALGGAFLSDPHSALAGLAAAVYTAVMHIWKRNALLSIFGGTALYMLLLAVF